MSETIEGGAVKFVDEVKAEVVKVAEEVKAEIAPEAKKAVVSISAEEKLYLSDCELEFLKAQGEIQRLTKITESKAAEYKSYVEGLLTKYGISKAEYLFDGVKREFQLIAKKA
jgi:hypothetical protein